jgi:membrane protein YdbS with pleckstrin-like domain
MTSLEKGQHWVMLVRSMVTSLVLLAAAAGLAALLQEKQDVPPALILVPALVVLGYAAFLSPGRRYRSWGYRMDEEELRLAHGVWTRVETLVPLKRVQHLDIAQGPIERSFAVCRLVLHTAGTAHSLVVLPGLSRETAEAMRADIRARIRREAE